jgi:hypothetical protein
LTSGLVRIPDPPQNFKNPLAEGHQVRLSGELADLLHLWTDGPDLPREVEAFPAGGAGRMAAGSGPSDQVHEVLDLGALGGAKDLLELLVGVGLCLLRESARPAAAL